MKYTIYITIALISLAVAPVQAAPVLFNDAMSFDNHPFGLVDFDATGQDTLPEINTYLGTYTASAEISAGSIVTGQLYAQPISQNLLLYGSGTTFTVTFSDPVNAAGAFLIGIGGNSNPYSGGIGCYITVWLANGGGNYQYDYRSLLPIPASSYSVTGFFGVFEQAYGIEKIEIKWNRDAAGIDNFYFSDTVAAGDILNSGPAGVLFSNIPTIPLPEYGTGSPAAIPEPASMVLLGMGLTAFIKRTMRK
ncbi:MAG: PEP-CTERM sorting domain-containing protein [Candidatus Auribacterota bacterium]